MHVLGGSIYCESLMILIKKYTNFHKYEKDCSSKVCKAKIEFFTNIRMTRNSEKKNKQILQYNWQLQYKKTHRGVATNNRLGAGSYQDLFCISSTNVV